MSTETRKACDNEILMLQTDCVQRVDGDIELKITHVTNTLTQNNVVPFK